ncbi:o-succinylbenzoate synthase [Botryobacter ruber]|uniref:o-succinylbenzoate synthase n=1 Tax=Botryobacter ruber TaxID=2171629 RepID=UPI000E0C741B|nr:o-succinylbenzoate synthase [Botryobacter ruber]
MTYQARFTSHTLRFKFDARTSRGAITEHTVYYVSLWQQEKPDVIGVGECAPLSGLSIDYRADLSQQLAAVCEKINAGTALTEDGTMLDAELELEAWPSVKFALETALLDLRNGGKRKIYDNAFSRGEAGIPINGLVWMGEKEFMQEQIQKKLEEGYTCLKLKIGSLHFATELELLETIRSTAGADKLTIRVDANGAFTPEEAFRKLERLARYELHSIEQPIKHGQPDLMAQLCAYTPVPIALDEELIGVQQLPEKIKLLDQIKPQYIILKPTLVGGLAASAEWIQLTEERKIGWWMTSALESNIGLNAISQFTANYDITLQQGLGTGQLYHNNIPSPLQIERGELWYKPGQEWGDVKRPGEVG